ncbi:MAG: hypothetical protein M3Y27_27335 [Acidobacteriota bacterium]|nr:hypothetical protein [Acidobacteriota bacterium]
MTEETKAARGRPITNQVDQIPASPEDIAKAIFRAADKKLKPVKKKPN